MPWQDMKMPLRVLVNDLDTPYVYTDFRLEQVLLVSARLVSSEIQFPVTYTIDLVGSGISPDPVDTNDTYFTNLTILKAACLTDRAEARAATAKGVYIKDGTATVDTRDFAVNKLQMIEKGKGGYCDAYEDAKFEYGIGPNNPARIITGPVRTIDGFPYT